MRPRVAMVGVTALTDAFRLSAQEETFDDSVIPVIARCPICA